MAKSEVEIRKELKGMRKNSTYSLKATNNITVNKTINKYEIHYSIIDKLYPHKHLTEAVKLINYLLKKEGKLQ